MTLTVAGQSEAIERLVALSKFATGAAAVKLVDEALSTTSLFVFSELKELPNIIALEMNNVRDLENLIIESIFVGIIVGKLNQQAQSFEVQKVMARDFLPGMKSNCDTIVSNIDKQKEFLLQDHTKKQQAFNAFSDDLELSHMKLSTAGKQNQNPSLGINRGKKRPNWE